jgi:hypothetical protein
MWVAAPHIAWLVPHDFTAHLLVDSRHRQPRREGVAEIMRMQIDNPAAPACGAPSCLDLAAATIGFTIGVGEEDFDLHRGIWTKPSHQTIADLAVDYLERHAVPKKRPNSVRDDRAMLDNIILPKLGAKKADAISRRDIEAIQVAMKGTP